MARTATYECKQCGTKVVVTEAAGTRLQPIYCCGMEVAEVDSVRRQLGAKALKSGGKKTASKPKHSVTAKVKAKKKVLKKK